MSERDGFEPGVPCWVDTAQPDPGAACDFYGGVFGWEFEGPGPMPSGGEYFVARLRGRDVAGIGSQPEGAPPTPAWNTYVWVESAGVTAERTKDAGGSVIAEPFDIAPAGRMAVVADPAGAVLCAFEPDERKGAQLVNEPGAWSMSLLSTRDPDGAAAFYRSVFGWGTEEFNGATLFRLPGYEGGEPSQPVPRDVVAVMAPMGDDVPADAPPHWGVDFWIDDADTAAGKAEELGGKVVVPPYDIPGFREATLADPAGASFTVSQLVVGG